MPGLKLPRPYPDELVGSMHTRAMIHNGLIPKHAVFGLLGADRTAKSQYLPSDVPTFAAKARMTPEIFLHRHTVLPYCTAFMSGARAGSFRLKALAGCTSGETSLSSLVKSVSRSAGCWRFCRACLDKDMRERGESYWRRAHCMPAVQQCLTHEEVLFEAVERPLTVAQSLALPLPQRQPLNAIRCAAPSWATKELASLTAATYSSQWTHQNDWASTYRRQALENGFALPGSVVASSRLAYMLRIAYGEEFLASLGVDFKAPGTAWPALMLRDGVREPFAPVKHVLLQAFLKRNPGVNAVFVSLPPGPKPMDLESLDSKLAAFVMKQTKLLLASRDSSTVQALLAKAGLWQAFRHHRTSLPRARQQIKMFKATEASDRKSGGRAAHSKRLRAIAEGRQKPATAWSGRAKSGDMPAKSSSKTAT